MRVYIYIQLYTNIKCHSPCIASKYDIQIHQPRSCRCHVLQKSIRCPGTAVDWISPLTLDARASYGGDLVDFEKKHEKTGTYISVCVCQCMYCHAMLCNVMYCNVVMLCNITQRSVVQRNAMSCNVIDQTSATLQASFSSSGDGLRGIADDCTSHMEDAKRTHLVLH